MSNPDTQDLLIFVGIPLAVIAIIFALVYASGSRGAKRYRPGRPYQFAPVWFLARPETDGPGAAARSLEAAATSKALEAAPEREHPGVTGGASDRW